jgi:hypothetical protein
MGGEFGSASMKTKKSLRDTIAENQKAMNMWAAVHGKPQTDIGVPAKRAPNVKRTADEDTEAAVLKEVGQLLANHPKVLFAVRQNSGMAYNESKAPVYFYRFVRCKEKMRISDFWGLLTDGRPFACEVKNRAWTKPSGEREAEQQAFLLTVKYAGGVSGFCTSAAQAQAIIESQHKE